MFKDVRYQCEECLERTVLTMGRKDPKEEACETCGGGRRNPVKEPGSVTLKPCPFCGGPPVPSLRDCLAGKPLDFNDLRKTRDGIYVIATVFCHECGCDGPSIENNICFAGDAKRLLDGAVRRWQERGSTRSMECYEIKLARHTFTPAGEAAE